MAAPTRATEPFSIFLNRWLREHGWTQVRLADAVGVHETVVGRWLHADERRRAHPGRHTLPRLAEVLELPLQEVVVMLIADEAPAPPTEAAARQRLDARRQAVTEQVERWIAAVGPAYEEYFWRHLKAQGDSTVSLIRGLGTAVSQAEDAAISTDEQNANGTKRKRRRGDEGPLRAHQRPSHVELNLPRVGQAHALVA